MKKYFFLSFLVIFLFIPSFKTNADVVKGFTIRCDSIPTNDIINCSLEYPSVRDEIYSFSGKIEKDDNFLIFDDNGVLTDDLEFEYKNLENIESDDIVFSFKCKVLKPFSGTNIKVSYEINGIKGTVFDNNASSGDIFYVESNGKLPFFNSLIVENKKIFNNEYSYYGNYYNSIFIEEEKDKIDIEYELASSDSTVEIIGNENLKFGRNDVVIKVTLKDGTVGTYNLSVYKPSEKRIKKLEIENVKNIDLNFDPYVCYYTIEIPDDVKKLDFSIELFDDRAKYEIINNDDLHDDDKILIKVTGLDDDTKTYSLLVKKIKEITPSERRIKKLEIVNVKNIDLGFDPDKYEYTIEIPHNIKGLEFSVELFDNNSKYEVINNKDLLDEDMILIEVTGEDKLKTTYSISIKRKVSETNIYLIILLVVFNIIMIFVVIKYLKRYISLNKKNI